MGTATIEDCGGAQGQTAGEKEEARRATKVPVKEIGIKGIGGTTGIQAKGQTQGGCAGLVVKGGTYKTNA